jgi:hypothetical protein
MYGPKWLLLVTECVSCRSHQDAALDAALTKAFLSEIGDRHQELSFAKDRLKTQVVGDSGTWRRLPI